MKKTVLMLSVALTIFIIGIVAAVGKVVANGGLPFSVSAGSQPKVSDREAAYNQLIDRANQRLAEANQVITDLKNQLQNNPAAQSGYFPMQDAARAAMAASGTGAALASVPDLVDYQGRPTYEITMTDGVVVHVDAVSGLVAYNSLTGDASPAISPDQASTAALDYMKSGKVKKVTRAVFNDAPVYKVSFKGGSYALIDMRGQVVYVKLVHNVTASNPSTGTSDTSTVYSSPTYYYSASTANTTNSSSSQNSGSSDHHESDNHEGGDD